MVSSVWFLPIYRRAGVLPQNFRIKHRYLLFSMDHFYYWGIPAFWNICLIKDCQPWSHHLHFLDGYHSYWKHSVTRSRLFAIFFLNDMALCCIVVYDSIAETRPAPQRSWNKQTKEKNIFKCTNSTGFCQVQPRANVIK